MSSYIFIVFYIVFLLYPIYKDLVRYKKGNYFSDSATENDSKSIWNNMFVKIAIFIGAFVFVIDDKPILFITVSLVILAIATLQSVILSYLTYKKTNDKKMIINTIIFHIGVIIVILILLKWSNMI